MFRRLQPGENPDTEIGRFLTEVAHFPRIAPFLGDIRGSRAGDSPPADQQTPLAMLQGLVANEGDGWQYTLEELARYYESSATCPAPKDLGTPASFLDDPASPRIPVDAREHAWLYLDAAALLGRRTAEMHLALATPTDNPAFAAEPFTAADLAADARRIESQVTRALATLRRGITTLPDELTITIGESIRVLAEYDDGWVLGMDARGFDAKELGSRRDYARLSPHQAWDRWANELHKLLRSLERVVRRGGAVVLLMADSAVGDEPLPADEIVAEVARDTDLECVARASQLRHHSASGVTGRTATRRPQTRAMSCGPTWARTARPSAG